MAIKNIHIDENIKWWSELKHGGMLISPVLIKQYFDNINELSNYKYNQLRDKYISFEAIRSSQKDIEKLDTEVIIKWVDYILQVLLEHNPDNIAKGRYIKDKYKLKTILGQSLLPDRVIFSDASRQYPLLLVSIQKSDKIGTGKDRKKYTEFIELLRGTGVKLGVITNGIQFRLCYAGLDYDAWTEWDAGMWFIESEWRKQLDGFIALIGKDGLKLEENNSKLIKIIEESRNKQSEISDILGQQIREAVEILINQLDITVKTNPELLDAISRDIDGTQKSEQQINNALYQAASRIIMRIVVLLFAEARNLLPRDIVQYNESYGIEGLFEQLKMALVYENKLSVKNQYGSWRRIISLFNLVHEGSNHYLISLQGYGGILFERGNLNSEDEILQCISIFENVEYKLNDYQVYQILEKIKIGKLKVKQGNRNVWVKGPVDFADLKTEYIGIMYEGLLDYSLKRANEPFIVLNIGNQPILPLSNLEQMTDKEIKDLIKKLKDDSTNNDNDNENDENIDTYNNDYESSKMYDNENNIIDAVEKRARNLALRVVILQNKVRKTKNMDEITYNNLCIKEADKLVIKILHEKEYYIASQGGTRKGSGTFYTKPGLAIPTTQRTLKPLLYDIDEDGNEVPKKPKDILQVTVCDPTCGSGTFLVAATDYITEALTKSILYNHSYKSHYGKQTRVLPFGTSSKGKLDEELLPVPPEDPKFEEFLRVYLRRHVVERCIYGVDINPMAVELAKLSLWINTMNEKLPFTFLDHKIKIGNGIVGTWFDQFKHYPIRAWNREGGDKAHSNGVNYKKGEWTKSIKEFLNKTVKPDLIKYIEQFEYIEKHNYDKGSISNENIEYALENVIQAIDEFNSLPVSISGMKAKEEVYKNKIINNEYMNILKQAFDEWCALWFWSADELDDDVPLPTNFHNMTSKTKQRVKRIAKEMKFFHWELEFPDVFIQKNSGFSAILGNPPWDALKSNSLEFFTIYDPIYRTYGKQEAIKNQKKLFELNYEIEKSWLLENLKIKALSNWISSIYNPYGDSELDGQSNISITRSSRKNSELHSIWRSKRNKEKYISRNEHIFKYQGSGDLNKYKLFSEISYSLIKDGGRLGFITPSNIYSDKGTEDIRRKFINESKWEWIFSFENRDKIFNIDSRFKFCIMIINKGGSKNDSIKCAFMQHKIENWYKAQEYYMDYPIEKIKQFSPYNGIIVEVETLNDIKIIEKIYKNSIYLKDSFKYEWNIKYSTEFHMTGDSRLFIERKKIINDRSDIYGRVLQENKKLLPLYQGAMIWEYDFCYQKYINNDWVTQEFASKKVTPKYYMLEDNYPLKKKNISDFKVVSRNIQSTTNERTKIVSIIPDYPTGHSLSIINGKHLLAYVAIANSFVFDFIIRKRMSQNNVSMFYLEEMPLPKDIRFIEVISIMTAKLNLCNEVFADRWLLIKSKYIKLEANNWYSLWALTDHERLRLRCILDAVVAEMYGLDYEDLAWILKNDETDPKGFWRVDKDKPINMRHTTLTLVAFKRLKQVGIEEFLKEDWQLPKEVADAMGPRILDWQLEKSVEESWEECEQHAREFLGDEEYEKFIEELGQGGVTYA